MKSLNFDTLRSLAFGIEYAENQKGQIIFSRFSKSERESLSYGRDNSFATAGIRLEFLTDSRMFKISVGARSSNEQGRNFYSFDVYCNGKFFGSIKNFNSEPVYPYKEYRLADRHKTYKLPNGVNHISVYFPWSVQGVIKDIEIDDNAFIKPVPKGKKLIMYGDSITQGYDAALPSASYASRLADLLCTDCINKGIGGSVFMPELTKQMRRLRPDIITVAYGTNDWNISEYEDFSSRCMEFFDNIYRNCPSTPVFAISPIWRADCNGQRKAGTFAEVSEFIKNAVSKYENMFFINGFDFVPKKEIYFRDGYLHPNDKGFEFYTKAISEQINYFTEETK